MSAAFDHPCRYCGRTTSVDSFRLFDALWIGCDRCFADQALTPSQRLEIVKSASWTPSTSAYDSRRIPR
jgi:hypothetical protein